MRYFQTKPADEFEFQEIIYEKRDWVARITINRPHNYNAYSTLALAELATAFGDASFDDKIAVIVFTGAGKRAFCTGGDVKEYEANYTRVPRDYWKYMGLFKAYIESILNTGKPVIARLNGMAVGGGNESQLACDLSVIAEHAYIAQVGTNVGSVACGGSTQWLPVTVGDRRAREILLLNDRIRPFQALEWGLVNRVAPSVTKDGRWIERASAEEIKKAQQEEEGYAIDLTKLDEVIDELVQKLIRKFPECTRYTKQNLNFWKDMAWHQTIGHARDWLSIHYTSWEPLEGMQAFVEKRPADYVKLRELAAAGKSSEFKWGPYTQNCGSCGATGIPAEFGYCGMCGALLENSNGAKAPGAPVQAKGTSP